MNTDEKAKESWCNHLIKIQERIINQHERNLAEAKEHLEQLKAYKILKDAKDVSV
jgi:hypothetical protein